MKALIESWEINERINEFLIDALAEEHFSDKPVAKGRSVGEQFAHIHNVRMMWLKAASPDLLKSVQKLENITKFTSQFLITHLKKSSTAITALLNQGFTTGRIKGFKPHPEGFLSYLIAHESHHRGQIILILKENGHMPDKKILYGLWEWGSR